MAEQKEYSLTPNLYSFTSTGTVPSSLPAVNLPKSIWPHKGVRFFLTNNEKLQKMFEVPE